MISSSELREEKKWKELHAGSCVKPGDISQVKYPAARFVNA
jgi:hypothetical protein